MAIDLGAYLDQIDDDTVAACAAAPGMGTNFICLRRAWSLNITAASDQACQAIMQALRKNSLTAVEICSDIGGVPVGDLTGQIDQLKRAILVANYFRARYLRVHAGFGPLLNDDLTPVSAWFETVASMCQNAYLTPLLELTPDSTLLDHPALEGMIADTGVWKVQYDPANLILRRRADPIPYLDYLSQHLATIDLHDYKIGVGFHPVGTGDCPWLEIMKRLTGWQGLYLIESGLGRRYGPAETRQGTFTLAREAVATLFNRA